MIRALLTAASTAAAAILFVSSAQATTALTPGIYDLEATVTSATSVNGSTCTAGANWSAWLYYPGPGKAGGAIRHPAVGSAQENSVILALPKAPPATNFIWSGAYKATVVSSTAVTNWGGSFQESLRVADTRSFFGSLSLSNYETGGQICDFIFNAAGVYVGPLP